MLYDLLLRAVSGGSERPFRDELVGLARIAPGEDVLDVGCATGTLALAAKRRVGAAGTVQGIDPAPEMIARARTKARRAGLDVDFRTVSAEALPLEEASADVVLCTLVMHHLAHEGLHAATAEMRRVLRPGGRLLFVDIGGPQDGRRTLHSPHGGAGGAHGFDLMRIVPRLDSFGLRELESGEVATRLRRLERLRYVLAVAA